MINKTKEIIKLLKEGERLQLYPNLQCWIKEITAKNSFKIHVFSNYLSNEIELENVWKKLKSDIAAYFQTALELEVEIWNIYIFFFVSGKVCKELKYEVEQDKYSSRKIIIDEIEIAPDDLEKFEKEIENTLFSKIEIQKLSKNPGEKSFAKLIEEKNPELYKIIKDGDPKKTKEYLERLQEEWGKK